MQSNTGTLDSSLRVLLTVNSTSNTAFSTITDLAAKTAWGQKEQNEAMAVDTVAASRGRIIDLGRSRTQPYIAAPDLKSGRALGGFTGEPSQGDLSLPTRLILFPVGGDASPDGKDFFMQVHALQPIFTSDTGACGLWDFRPIIQIQPTLGAKQVGGASIGGSAVYYSKSIAITANANNTNSGAYVAAGSVFAAYPGAGSIIIPTFGARWIYLRFTLDGAAAAATNMNCLWTTN